MVAFSRIDTGILVPLECLRLEGAQKSERDTIYMDRVLLLSRGLKYVRHADLLRERIDGRVGQ